MTDSGRRPLGLPQLWESPEVPTRQRHTAASWLGHHVVWPVWLWRREGVVLLGPGVFGAVCWLALVAGRGAAPSSWGLLAGCVAGTYGVLLVLVVPVVRRGVGRWLAYGRIRREWDRACRWAGLVSVSARTPKVTSIEPFTAGDHLTLRLPKGLAVDDVETAAERVAVVLGVREVRVMRDPDAARYASVHVIRRNPFRDRAGIPARVASPLVSASSWSLWDGVPVGIGELGQPVKLSLPGRNLLVGGEPEAGKSVAMSQVLAAAALDPTARIWGLDAKSVELALWNPVLEGVVENSIDDAISLVADLASEMDARYAKLKAESIRGVSRALGWPLYVLAIDELRFYTNHPEKKKRDAFNAALIDVVARGRAAGIIVVAATQRPSSDVVPTSLRDLFAYRWALRCSTREASDTILGSGWATQGYTASVVDPLDRGVGLLLAEGGIPQMIKSAYLDDNHIRAIASRGADLRGRG